VEAAGIAPASGEAEVPVPQCLYGKSACFWLEIGWESSASRDTSGQPKTLPPELNQVIEAWPSLPRHIVRAVMALVESALEAPE
jgi:hypothetical protein